MADIIDEVITEEGGSKVTDDPSDPGGRTQYGISERAHPEAWLDGHVTYDEARTIYEHDYVTAPGFDKIPFEPLRDQLIDFGVNSGPVTAIKYLQLILHVDRDGVLGPETLAALAAADPKQVNNTLAALRENFFRDLARARPDQRKYLKGWLKRAESFYLP